VAVNVTAAHAVQDPSQASAARRAALELAQSIGFSEARAGQAALVASELATNLAKHATGGELVVSAVRKNGGHGAHDGLEIVAMDRGPGMPDVARARQDGYSTAGTLGHGLGTIERQSDFFQIYSWPSGTVAMARLWSQPPAPSARQPLYEIGAILVSHPGEQICGDQWGWTMRDGRFAIMVADGLGHGISAHDAAAEALAVFHGVHEEAPARVIGDVHAALRATRGAAVAMIAVDTEREVARFCGLGNVGTVMIGADGSRHGMISQNGTAGHVASRINEFSYPFRSESMLVMFSDGLVSHWDLAAYPGLITRHPSVIAGVLYRDFSRRRDDVTVVVAKRR
jgi:anti-sigma regulatory factor (Ser/Thr protein kinase)